MTNTKGSAEKLLREVEQLRIRLSEGGSPLTNNEVWSIQQSMQVTCGHLIISYQDIALEKGVERDLWNFGFRTTITQLQSEAKDKKKGNNEAKDVLNWFLNAASGFYLQLLNQICSLNSLDLVFRRKDSIYGLVGGNLSTLISVKPNENVTKNSLYLCQYCLIHLGDLARYRHQAKQAETFYRHAVTVAATSGQPYNQLALLEAGRGNRLTSVFLYIRALCVTAPFLGAPSNLIQTMSKVLSNRSKDREDINEIKIGTQTRMTKDEYINLFLHFHSSLFLKGDLEMAKEDLPRLSSALSMLVATTTLTRSSLVQMFAVNVFALHYFSGRINLRNDEITNKKEEEKLIEPKECDGALDVLEDLMVSMLAALLLPVHTMKEPEVVLTYPALPAIRLMFEWIFLEDKLLSPALRKKQQIWPGLCTLANFLQQPLDNFDFEKYNGIALPEDWDLQEFQPLQKILNKYKYRENSRLSPDQYSLLRAKRFTDLALKFCQNGLEGGAVIKTSTNDQGLTKFEAMFNQTPVEEVLDLEKLTLQPKQDPVPSSAANKKKEKVGILKPQGSLERSKASPKEYQLSVLSQHQATPQILKDPSRELEKKHLQSLSSGGEKRVNNVAVTKEVIPTVIVKPKSTRTNVALQAILKRNSNTQEAKQVTFQTPSPSASPNPSDTSCESQRSQLSTPPLPPANQPHNLSPSSLTSVSLMGPPPSLSNPPPFQNASYHQKFPLPIRVLDHPTTPNNSSSLPPTSYPPPNVLGAPSYPHVLGNTITPRGDNSIPYLGISPPNHPSCLPSHPPSGPPPKGLFGPPGIEEKGPYYQNPPPNIGIGRAGQDHSMFNRSPYDSQANPASSLYGRPQIPMNWKSPPLSENNLGPSSPQMKSPGFGGIFNTRPMELPFKENSEFQHFLPNYHQNFPANPTKDNSTSSLAMYMDNSNSRGLVNPNISSHPPPQTGNLSLSRTTNIMQMNAATSGPPPSSNLFQGNPGANTSWWNKDGPGNGLRNPPYQFSNLGSRPSFQVENGSPPSMNPSVPPSSLNSGQFQNRGLGMPGGGSGTGPGTTYTSDNSMPLEGSNPMRMTNTYSLFGPLGGVRDAIQPTFPQNNRMLNPTSSQQSQPLQPQSQQPQYSHHSLWSGPSPLQRLLEQKKFSTK